MTGYASYARYARVIAKPNQKLMQLAIDKTLHRRFKVRCIELGTTMSERIEHLIRAWLRKRD